VENDVLPLTFVFSAFPIAIILISDGLDAAHDPMVKL